MRRPKRIARRAIAICAALLWLVGVEVLPNLHLATHDRAHTHASDGTIISHDEAEHHHFDESHHVEHHHALDGHRHYKKKQPPNPDTTIGVGEHGHVAAGIAHRATALLDPPTPITTPLAVPLAEAWQSIEPALHFTSIARSRPNARGPPVA